MEQREDLCVLDGHPSTHGDSDAPVCAHLLDMIEHVAHLLPSQGPITVFVHHNTLHSLEDLSFEKGVVAGMERYHCHPFLLEEEYRQKLASGRIRVQDLEAVLMDDLGEEADQLVASFGTRYALRLAMLQYPLDEASDAELHWLMAECDALRRFRTEASSSLKSKMITGTREFVLSSLNVKGERGRTSDDRRLIETLYEEHGRPTESPEDENRWEALTLDFLWQVCHRGLESLPPKHQVPTRHLRVRDDLLANCDMDPDELVHEILIRFCAEYFDQGFASWPLPDRDQGFYDAFLSTFSEVPLWGARWMREVEQELEKLKSNRIPPLESIASSLADLGILPEDREEFITQTLLALRGWAGMIWQLETNAPWTPRPARLGSLVEFLAVRLILDRHAARYIAADKTQSHGDIPSLQRELIAQGRREHQASVEERAFSVFQLAQARLWLPHDLLRLSQVQWQTLIDEIESFDSLERRRVYHLAYERKYRTEALDALSIHARRVQQVQQNRNLTAAVYQILTCIDDREESFRRALEEIDPECETFGLAGFFGVAMYYQGIAEAHYRPLCPVNVIPKHYVREEPFYSQQDLSRRQEGGRRRLGQMTHRVHMGSRGFFGGVFTGLLGSIAAFPLVARVLFPVATARIRRYFQQIVEPSLTELHLERITPDPGTDYASLGYSVAEMADIVQGGLRATGMLGRLSRLVIIFGHGSGSMNNPHESAYNCGACSGGRGGANARAFAQMANDHRVRAVLRQRNAEIDEEVVFVGGYHNTCDDSLDWFDLDRIPFSHRPLFERARKALDEARQRSAHERCRRFYSVDSSFSPTQALKHVHERAEDLSQARPEYNHATNSMCFVGRRMWSRGLFLDRRAFLASYDPQLDDAQSTILERLLQAVIPVCAGISLEYYFSTVDVEGYGCGSKLPHNITSLLGVMSGAASDLRTGLSAQMVEIHEPMRILFVIETAPESMKRIIRDNPAIRKLVEGGWVQVATIDPDTATLHRYYKGEFRPYSPESKYLPISESSVDWYGQSRESLGFSSIGSIFSSPQ